MLGLKDTAPDAITPRADRTQPLTSPASAIVGTEVNAVGGTDGLAPDLDVTVTPQGSLSAHLPLWVPPGRGITPDLSIDYNSTAGGGILGRLGYGWSLSGLPTITRCRMSAADSGSGTSAIKMTNSDQLCVDGEPLVPETPGATLGQGVALRRLHDNHQRFIISRADPLGPARIDAYGRDGRIMTFGWTNDGDSFDHQSFGGVLQSQQYAFSTISGDHSGPLDGVQVGETQQPLRYGWLLAHVADRNGNTSDYKYFNEKCVGTGFMQGAGQMVEPREIYYSHNDTSGLTSQRYVNFFYDAPVCDSSHAQWVAGLLLFPTLPITRIQLFGPNNDNSAQILLHQYLLSYGNDSGATATLPAYMSRNVLTGIQECDGGITAASPNGVCTPPVTFSYGEDQSFAGNEWADLPYANIQPTVLEHDGMLTWPPHMYLTDLNRDGRRDLLYMAANTTGSNNSYVAQLAGGPWEYPVFSSVLQSGPPTNYAPPLANNAAGDLNRLFPSDILGIGYGTTLLKTEDVAGGSFWLFNATSNQFTIDNGLSGLTAGEMADLDAMPLG